MTKTKTVIEINGKRYDAVSGRTLAGSAKQLGTQTIDGVVRGKHPAAQPLAPPLVKQAVRPAAVTPKTEPVMDVRRMRPAGSPASPKKHRPQGSQTLMRQAVNKPAASFKTKVASHTRTDVLARQPSAPLLPKLSFHAVDAKREVHAQRIAKSKLVSRFGATPAPEHAHIAPAAIAARPAPQISAVALPASVAEPAPLPSRRPAQAMFERALLKANSHEQPAPVVKKQRRASKKPHRFANASALTLAVALVAGFLVYQNMANITIHLAASKAGFAATLPGYRPSGFSIGKFAYSTGNVTIHFHSNSDANRSFALIEQPSNWDSSTLLNDFVNNAAGNSYQTASAAGRIIYLYGNNNATWVSGGVWYQVTNQNGLSTAQLVNLAASM